MGGKSVEVKELRVVYCEKNNGGKRKIVDFSKATLTFDQHGNGKFIRGSTDEIYDISNMEIKSFLYESARRI